MNRVLRIRVVPLVLAMSLASWPAPAGADAPQYPATVPGRHAREYFAAYASGEDAMRAYWATHGSPAALAQRPVEARLGVWRRMREAHGALTPVRVGESGDDFIDVVARATIGAPVLIRFLCEADPAHGLVALRIEDAEDDTGGDGGERPAVDPGPPPTDAELVAALTAELDSLARGDAFSGAAVLDRNGTPLFERAYGTASRAEKRPNRIDTRFNLASINKIFTQLAIHQLADAGKLKLQDTIDRHLADYPKENGSRITIQMLLEHRGGVPDVLNHPKLSADPARVRTMADWYRMARDMPLDFAPGTRRAYSNGGYCLLGEIIARVAKEDYYDYVRRHIYEPAGMTRTGHYANDETVEGRAVGYSRDLAEVDAKAAADRRVANTRSLPGRGSPAGGGYSTVGDLVRFAGAMRSGKLRPQAKPGAAGGLGIAGGSPGVNGMLLVSGPYTLAILSNYDPPSAERFLDTVGRMVERAGGTAGAERIRVGGPR